MLDSPVDSIVGLMITLAFGGELESTMARFCLVKREVRSKTAKTELTKSI